MVRFLGFILAALLAAFGGQPSVVAAEGPGQNQVSPTILGPVPDGMSLKVPLIPDRQELAAWGLADVTSPLFGADPTGQRDSTAAIQAAVNFARDHQMACFFPPGTYLVSDTIDCVQSLYQRTSGAVQDGREHPCVLMGSRAGARPKIVLAQGAPGFANPAAPRSLIHFWARGIDDPARHQPNISMNQMLVNIDVVIGQDNRGAVAIHHQAAQGSAIQECDIDATHGFAGIMGGIGSGGSIAGVTVRGGQIGLDLRQAQPAPTIAGVTLVGQTRRAIVYSGSQTLSAVGVSIRSSAPGPLIETGPVGGRPHQGQLCLVDSVILLESGGRTAISAGSSLYLGNVYIRGAEVAVAGPNGERLDGDPSKWLHVRDYALGVTPMEWKGHRYPATVYYSGHPLPGVYLRRGDPEAPPPGLIARHLPAAGTPGPDIPGVANVKLPPYSAAGDGRTDDTAALQRALDENPAVFLPKGYYLLSRPLRVGPRNQMAGVAGHLSVLLALPGKTAFASLQDPQPLVQTEDSPHTTTRLAYLGLFAPREVPGAFALDWRCGGEAELRSVNVPTNPPLGGFAHPGSPPLRNHPLVMARGHGGGNWYNLYQDDAYFQGPGYRHIALRGLSGPLRIYQCNPEHGQGQANLEIVDSEKVDIFGLKSEGNHLVSRIRNAANIRIFGYGGNAAALEGQALFEVENCRRCLLANLVDSPRLSGEGEAGTPYGAGLDPERWSMVRETGPGGMQRGTAPSDRPVIYIMP